MKTNPAEKAIVRRQVFMDRPHLFDIISPVKHVTRAQTENPNACPFLRMRVVETFSTRTLLYTTRARRVRRRKSPIRLCDFLHNKTRCTATHAHTRSSEYLNKKRKKRKKKEMFTALTESRLWSRENNNLNRTKSENGLYYTDYMRVPSNVKTRNV